MDCPHYYAGRCRSCSLIEPPLPDQLRWKEAHCRSLIGDEAALRWLPPYSGRGEGFRNKAKMAVSGTAARPVLGLTDETGGGVDLTDCPLYPPEMQALFPSLSAFITEANLPPYHLRTRRGELKYLIVTHAEDSGRFMVRFVLRSRDGLGRIKKHLPRLLEGIPSLAVVTINLQPVHKAILEGEEEICLTEEESLPMKVNDLLLHLRPKGFFQTNTGVAAALYAEAKAWVEELNPASVWDLFCGIGGFALHAAGEGRALLGMDVSAEAIAGAERSCRESGLSGVSFKALDMGRFSAEGRHPPEMIIVNPPRRGLGETLCRTLDPLPARWVIYSSCRAETLARDLSLLPGWRPLRARLFDMFPHTPHYEVMLLLEREGAL